MPLLEDVPKIDVPPQTLSATNKLSPRSVWARKEKVVAYMRDNPGKWNKHLVSEMRKLGMERPDFIPEESWEGAMHERTWQSGLDKIVMYMCAWGMTNEEIKTALRINSSRVTDIRVKQAGGISDLQQKIFGENPKKWIETLLPKAIKTALSLMEDEGVKPSVRLSAAQDFMDRALGKAAQKVEVEDNSMRAVLQALDKATKTIDVIDVKTIDNAEVKKELESIKTAVETKDTMDEVDKWAEKNIQKNK